MASAINLSGVTKAIRLPTPPANGHTREVLAELGYDVNQIAAFIGSGALD